VNLPPEALGQPCCADSRVFRLRVEDVIWVCTGNELEVVDCLVYSVFTNHLVDLLL
jgi:hypothetical protein